MPDPVVSMLLPSGTSNTPADVVAVPAPVTNEIAEPPPPLASKLIVPAPFVIVNGATNTC